MRAFTPINQQGSYDDMGPIQVPDNFFGSHDH